MKTLIAAGLAASALAATSVASADTIYPVGFHHPVYHAVVIRAPVVYRTGFARPGFYRAAYHKFYIDELYDFIIRKPLDALSDFCFKVLDRSAIDGLVNGIGQAPVEASKGFRLLQTGNVGFYIFMMVLGIISVLMYILIKV